MSPLPHHLITLSAHFLDTSHYDQIHTQFMHNLSNSPPPPTTTTTTNTSLIQSHLKYFEWVEIPWRYFERLTKSNPLSATFRSHGNAFYKSKQISPSLRNYNLAILFAEKQSVEHFLALANRSALFLGVGLAEEGLKDVEACLNLGEGLVGVAEVVTKLKDRKERLSKLVAMETGRKVEQNLFSSLSSGCHGKYSENVEIFEDQVKGRGLQSVGGLKKGTPILTEIPHTILLDKQTNWDTEHCSQCGRSLVGGVTAEGDVFSTYCTPSCSLKFSMETPNLPKLYPYIHQTTPLHDCLLAAKVLVKEFTTHHTPSNSVSQLISHPPLTSPITMTTNIFKAIFLGYLLHKLALPSIPPVTIATAALHLLHSLPYNIITLSDWTSPEGPITHALWDARARDACAKLKVTSFATGLFPMVALLNHSCDPNCVFVKGSGGGGGVVVTVRGVGQGEELCICYKQHWAKLGVAERRTYLKGYGFECGCGACEGGWHEPVRVKGGVAFEQGLKKGEELLSQGELEGAWQCFLELEEGNNRKEEWVVRGEEFGKRVLVEGGMRE